MCVRVRNRTPGESLQNPICITHGARAVTDLFASMVKVHQEVSGRSVLQHCEWSQRTCVFLAVISGCSKYSCKRNIRKHH